MRITKYGKKLKFTYIYITLVILFIGVLALVEYIPFHESGDNAYHIFINDTEVGLVEDPEQAQQWMIEARKEIAAASDELVFMEVDFEYKGEELLFGEYDKEEQVKERMYKVLQSGIIKTLQRAYTVKANEYMANLSSQEDVKLLLEAAIGKYDVEERYAIELEQDSQREFNVLQAKVVDTEVIREQLEQEEEVTVYTQAGIAQQLEEMFSNYKPEETDFEQYQLGITDMGFSEKIEIVEAYLPISQMKPVEEAMHELIEEQEQQVIYEVVSGDTLSEIAIKVNIPIDTIIAMNSDTLDDENSTLQIGQQLVITVPEPELSVVRKEVGYYEEIYDEDTVYIDVDNWYTYQTEVIQQPSAGFRKIIAEETFVNRELVSREILMEEVVMEAVAKVVKRGTIVPPTYIKPLSGGRLSSGYGPRKAPAAGASTYHKAQDWATPVGTRINASCGGTVTKAGWGSGYGYVVYIDHPDGRQTRYAHLSKVLVKVGQTVKQGERIALSGNTGITSGPHLHFEMLINGKQVNPMKYLQ